MVATTFAADTPLAVAGLVAKYGVAGNWLWWNGALSGILTVFFFSRLWRRAGVLTDVEFAEMRYGGGPLRCCAGSARLYLALPINLIIMGWVTRAMVTILRNHARHRPWEAAVLLFAVTALYSDLSGLWGVMVTDAFQFVVAMAGVIVLAVLAVDSIGGLEPVVEKSSAPLRARRGRLRRHPAHRSGVAAAVDPARVPRRAVVGGVVSRCGARRRRLRGAADPVREG